MRPSLNPQHALAALKTSLELCSKIGSNAPFLQATVDTVLQLMQYAEVCVFLASNPNKDWWS